MANVYQITATDGTVYDIVDQGGRALIAQLEAYTDYLGVTTTALVDGSTVNPVVIDGEEVTAKKGNIANYGSKEFIFNGTAWQEFGDLTGLGALAFENTAEVTGTAAAQTFTGTQATIESEATYTPAGSVNLTTTAQSIVSGISEATTATIKEVDDAGSVTAGTPAAFGAQVDANGVLSFTFTANTPTDVTLPTTKETTVVTEQGTATTGSIDIPTSAAFTGTQATIESEATYTPAGTNTASAVTGTAQPAD